MRRRIGGVGGIGGIGGVVLVAVLAAGTLTGCSGDPAPEDVAPTTEAEPAWNPCSGLDAETVGADFGAVFNTRVGSPDAPECTYTPQADGGPAFEVNYQTYAGSLEDLMETFGLLEEEGRTTVDAPDVAGADDARIIVDLPPEQDDDTINITAFVQNGQLVQVVNALQPAPYDRDALVASVKALLADLAANADSSGLTGAG